MHRWNSLYHHSRFDHCMLAWLTNRSVAPSLAASMQYGHFRYFSRCNLYCQRLFLRHADEDFCLQSSFFTFLVEKTPRKYSTFFPSHAKEERSEEVYLALLKLRFENIIYISDSLPLFIVNNVNTSHSVAGSHKTDLFAFIFEKRAFICLLIQYSHAICSTLLSLLLLPMFIF